MFKRTLVLTGLLLFVVGSVIAADDAPLKIVKPGHALRAARGTGLQGTITVGTLSAQLQSLSCKDLAVHVGVLHASSAALTSFASASATGEISSGQCSFSVTGLPAGGPFDVAVVAESVKNGCRLAGNATFGKVTFTRGAMAGLDVQLTPACE